VFKLLVNYIDDRLGLWQNESRAQSVVTDELACMKVYSVLSEGLLYDLEDIRVLAYLIKGPQALFVKFAFANEGK